VFGGGLATSPRIQYADLDGFGPKPVPFLCMVCHGGKPSLRGSNKSNFARFREFLFADFPGFTGTSYAVCGTDSPRRVMPNAIVTYKNFWTDSLRVLQYETSIVQPTGTCGN